MWKNIKDPEKKFMILKQMERQELQQKDTQFKLEGRVVPDNKLIPLRKKMEAQGFNLQDLGNTPDTIVYFTPPSSTENLLHPSQLQPAIEANPTSFLPSATAEDSNIFGTNTMSIEDHSLSDDEEELIFGIEIEFDDPETPHNDASVAYLPPTGHLTGIGAQYDVFMGYPDISQQDLLSYL